MEKFPQQNNTPTFAEKAKKVFKGMIVGTMIGAGAVASKHADAQTKKNSQEQTYSNTAREIKIGKETFIIKKSNVQFRFDKGPVDKVIHHNHALKIFYGMSSSHHEAPFEVINIYSHPNNPNIIIVEGNGITLLETIQNGESHMVFQKEQKKIYFRKNISGTYTEIGYKVASENFFHIVEEDGGNWAESNTEPK